MENCMTGACVGALHGSVALPQRWVQGLENGVLGRDEALRYAHGLAQLDVRDRGPSRGRRELEHKLYEKVKDKAVDW
eukprot:scaffold160351_cov18-Tisochrysis_lutea.AAC.1